MPFVDETSWENRWVKAGDLASGGQATTKLVRLCEGGQKLFVAKLLNRPKNVELRKRFYREATAIETLEVEFIPGFIESNAHKFDSELYKPYIIMSYIDGPTLSEWHSGKTMQLNDALAFTSQVNAIVLELHENGYIHRDIKPDNIIVRNGKPHLVDFGWCHEAGHSMLTNVGTEIGNRFLRLPEHGVTGANQRDLRSDVTFVCGLLFFLLTGHQPGGLSDGEGNLPHQRPQVKATLDRLYELHPRLSRLFDLAFALDINQRFQSSTHLQQFLGNMSEPPQNSQKVTESSFIDQDQRRAVLRTFQVLEKVPKLFATRVGVRLHEFNEIGIQTATGGYAVDRPKMEKLERVEVRDLPENRVQTVWCCARLVGSEIVLLFAVMNGQMGDPRDLYQHEQVVGLEEVCRGPVSDFPEEESIPIMDQFIEVRLAKIIGLEG